MGHFTPEEIKNFDFRMAQIGGLLGYRVDHERNAKYERGFSYCCFLRNGEMEIDFIVSDPKGRLSVSGSFPADGHGQSGIPYGETAPRITLSLEKKNEQIAGDIRRRFLTAYEELFSKAKKRVDDWNEYAKKRREQIAIIAAHLGLPVSDRDDRQTLYVNKWGVYVIDPHSDRDVELKIQVGADVAVQVLDLLKKVSLEVEESAEAGE